MIASKLTYIEPGKYFDKILIKWLKLPPRRKYSTKFEDAFFIIHRELNKENCRIQIDFEKQLMYQRCTVAFDGKRTESGYLPMAICLNAIQGLINVLKNKNYEELKKTYELLKKLDWDSSDAMSYYESQEIDFYETYAIIFETFTELEMKSLIKYATDNG